MLRAPDPDHPLHHYEGREGPYLLVPGTVFYDELYVQPKLHLVRQLFEDIEDKGLRAPKKHYPLLYSSFVLKARLMNHEEIVVDEIRVVLLTTDGWALPQDVHRWYCENAHLTVEVDRCELVGSLLGPLIDGYELPMAGRTSSSLNARAPRDVIRSNCEITGVLRILRDPGPAPRIADAIVRVEANGSWLVPTRRHT